MLCVCVLCCSLTTLTCVDVLDFRFAGTTNTTPPSYCFLRGGSFAPWLRSEHRCFSLMIFMGSVLLSTRPAILNKTVRIKFQQNPNNFNDRSKQVQDSSTQLPGINNNIKFHRMFRLAESRTILVKKQTIYPDNSGNMHWSGLDGISFFVGVFSFCMLQYVPQTLYPH